MTININIGFWKRVKELSIKNFELHNMIDNLNHEKDALLGDAEDIIDRLYPTRDKYLRTKEGAAALKNAVERFKVSIKKNN